ncbi:MAG: sulfatase-like hydrolase/transferase [Chitinivibrionales bacterium]|nr:sulfatase-like hydrolase/transferase [Chitinivibrionales bacterium]
MVTVPKSSIINQEGLLMSETNRKSNVVLFCCDHLRADWLGCNGHPLVMTPQIDKLAAQGVTFQRAFSECPMCVPARRTMMTGLGPHGIRMFWNRDTQPFPEGPKLAEVMTRAGYQTFASGKLHTCPQRNRIGFEDVQLNEEGRRQEGLVKDDYDAFLEDHGCAHRAYAHGLGNNQYGLRLSPLPEPFTTTHWTAQKAMEFLERRDPTRPFFLYVSFDKPHPPITPPAEYYELYREAQFPAPVMGDWVQERSPERVRRLRLTNDVDMIREHPLLLQQTLRGFAAMITHIDSMIGVILGQIRELVGLRDTHVLFTSDHGDQLFDHGNAAKGDYFRGSPNVPLIVTPSARWREEHAMRPGRVDRATPAGLMDIMPTILALCDVEAPGTIEGQSLLGRARDSAGDFRRYSFGRSDHSVAATDGRFVYQWFFTDDLEFLFDHDSDPREEHDLSTSEEHAATKKALRGALQEWLTDKGDELVSGGELVSRHGDRSFDPAGARSANCWNNRGRH